MEKEDAQALIKKLDNMDRQLGKIAEAASVLKVMVMAIFISALVVILKNCLP
jgi:hypothetical protein